ncbi:hypothetical protein M885DRAFT_320931 [Pelagophyceae sp. CCMP2097]|nr:hypothetical protein M885DRAFT_320931 [Pelagophyceae sp. CCMP2097]
MLAGIIMAHRELGFAFTPTKMPAIAHLLKRIEANSDPKGAASFDPAEDLKPMTQGLMCHPGRPFLKRIQDCTMLVLHFYLMARVSDMTVFAFDASDIKWPKNNSRHFGLDGQPLFCDVTLKQSKGKRKKADSHKRARSESPPALEPPALEPDSPPPLEPYSLGDLELAADIAAAGSIVNIYRSPFSPDPQRYKTAALPPDRPLPVLYGCVLPSVLSQPPLP